MGGDGAREVSLQTVRRYLHREGKIVWAKISCAPIQDDQSKRKFIGLIDDITERKKAEIEVQEINKRLLEVSRRAGMAEVATSVLHNVGNVLNSVNISATVVIDGLRKSQRVNLANVSAMLEENSADLGAFMTNDRKGKQLPGFIRLLSDTLIEEQEGAVKELESLCKHIDHIKDIVSKQQSYAKISGVSEIVEVGELVEDSLRMNAAALMRHKVEVVRDFHEVPPINVDKHKVLQILINLVRNAKYACDDGPQPLKRLVVRVANGEGSIKISVSDNGIGIPAENLTRIFSHGFTTRSGGHGFGLHSGSLTAKELGGVLKVHSDGPGTGATFTLEIPVAPTMAA
jgi:signal transduction histidine kinase